MAGRLTILFRWLNDGPLELVYLGDPIEQS